VARVGTCITHNGFDRVIIYIERKNKEGGREDPKKRTRLCPGSKRKIDKESG
jgi:hypothetical protein